ncbi:hypothetical protein [Pedobacter sp. Hv1]|uniref:hypothetical protein n=1 Tax=Pedobacter sp. Hv1 TaxID=1740090 RepID=UPI0006D8A9B4|nr:hypothetical protein [Pedobacter sp. Hv1]KQC02073.1 hypothetical protein AQF98_00430 [Pedobacter sp. Hv1]
MKFNSVKLAEDLRYERVVKQGISVPKAAAAVGITNSVYTRAEKDWGMDILVFTKLVTWLGKAPQEYFVPNKLPFAIPLTEKLLELNGLTREETGGSINMHLTIVNGFSNIAINMNDFSFAIYDTKENYDKGAHPAFDGKIRTIKDLEQILLDLTGELKQFKI